MRKVQRRFAAWVKEGPGTQDNAAELLGISQCAVSKIARGETSQPQAKIMLRIERATKTWPGGPIAMSEWAKGVPPASARTVRTRKRSEANVKAVGLAS